MDEETRAAFAALMQRMNDNHEALLNRMTALEGALRNTDTRLDSVISLFRSIPAAMLEAIQEPMLRRMGSLEARVSRLEPKGGA